MTSLANQYVDKDVALITATILNGGTTTDAILLYGCTAVKFLIPAAFTGTTITINGSIDGGVTYNPLYNSSGSQISYTVTTGGLYALNPLDLVGCDAIKLVASAQAAQRTILVKPFAS